MKSVKHLGDLTPDPANARSHNPRNIGTIADGLHEVGAARSIVIDEDGVVLAGNGVVEAAAQAGIERVQVVDADGETIIAVRRTGLTPAQKTRLALLDNRAAELADWDAGMLAQLREQDEALLAGLWDAGELDALLADVGKPEPAEDPGPQLDRAEELREKWGTARGQLWEIPSKTMPGRCHRLMCGDSTSAADVARLMGTQTIGAVVFDPPYDAPAEVLGVRYPARDTLMFTDHRHLLDCLDGWGHYRCLFVWDGVTSWYVPGWPLARCKLALWFGDGAYNADGAHYGEPDKAHTVSNTRGSYEYAPDPRGKHLSTVFQSPNTQQDSGHEHSKPVDWLRMLIANCTEGNVLDLFLGSGTALVACEQLGRTCLGMELNPATLAVAIERASGLGLEPRLSDD